MYFKILFLTTISYLHLVEAINPGTHVSAFGHTVDTSAMIQQIENRLYQKNSYGVQLRYKKTKECLDSDWVLGKFFSYSPYLNLCDATKASQNWRLINGVLKTGNKLVLPAIIGNEACMTCWSQLTDCYLYVMECREMASQRYFIRIHASQIDLVNGAIYFSFHSSQYPSRCIAPYWSGSNNAPRSQFYLEDCGGMSRQSFYLNGLEFDIDQLRTQVFGGGTGGTGDSFLSVDGRSANESITL